MLPDLAPDYIENRNLVLEPLTLLHREGVDGSSPSEGFEFSPA
jgi:hypothetical protein